MIHMKSSLNSSTTSQCTSAHLQTHSKTQLSYQRSQVLTIFASILADACSSSKSHMLSRRCLNCSRPLVLTATWVPNSTQVMSSSRIQQVNWPIRKSLLICSSSQSAKAFSRTYKRWATWHDSQMVVCSITLTTSIISQGWSSQTSCTTLWREPVHGRQSSAYVPPHASIKSAHMETTWSRKRLMIWSCVLLLTKIEYWYMNWSEKLMTIIGLRGADWWPIRNICSFRPPSCTQLLMVKDESECIMQQFLWQISPTCPSIILIRALWRCFGHVVLSQGLESTKETSNQSKLRPSSICKNYAELMPVH